MNFYEEIEKVLIQKSVTEKVKLFKLFYEKYKAGLLEFKAYEVKEFSKPSYTQRCEIVAPQVVPKRKNLTTSEGQIIFVHAVAHIEYSAIDLALDAAYRFHNLPREYYDDWLSVANDEVRHFEMLEKLLHELGASYGDVAVHNALFEASQRTAHSFIDRMAVVPRYLEANGLDATPEILEKLKRLPSTSMLEKIMATLEVIVKEEVDHVKKGDTWFAYACEKEDVSKESYFKIIDKYYPRTFEKKRKLNVEGRLEAGFSCSELKKMVQKEVCT